MSPQSSISVASPAAQPLPYECDGNDLFNGVLLAEDLNQTLFMQMPVNRPSAAVLPQQPEGLVLADNPSRQDPSFLLPYNLSAGDLNGEDFAELLDNIVLDNMQIG